MTLSKFDIVKHRDGRRGAIVALDTRYARVRWLISGRVTRIQRKYLTHDGKMGWADWMEEYK